MIIILNKCVFAPGCLGNVGFHLLWCASSPLDGFNRHLHLSKSGVRSDSEPALPVRTSPVHHCLPFLTGEAPTPSSWSAHRSLPSAKQLISPSIAIKKSMELEHQQKSNHLFLVPLSAFSEISLKSCRTFWLTLRTLKQSNISSLEAVNISFIKIHENTRYYSLTMTCKRSRSANCNQWMFVRHQRGRNSRFSEIVGQNSQLRRNKLQFSPCGFFASEAAKQRKNLWAHKRPLPWVRRTASLTRWLFKTEFLWLICGAKHVSNTLSSS